MFDLPDGRATTRYVNAYNRRMLPLERVFAQGVRKIYNKQFSMAAKMVEQGLVDYADDVVDETSQELKNVFLLNYRRIATVFSSWTLQEFEKVKGVRLVKTPQEDFWRGFDEYINVYATLKIRIVDDSQKLLIRGIIQKGMKENLSHQEIAKTILAKSKVVSKYKAVRIARTETHSTAVHSVQNQVKATGRRAKKQWSHSADERVRTKKFNHKINEIVDINEDYEETGEPLDAPGSSMGSAGNVINCRCVEKYFTR